MRISVVYYRSTGIETFRFTDIDAAPFARAVRSGLNALGLR
jgi:hypothetical protein